MNIVYFKRFIGYNLGRTRYNMTLPDKTKNYRLTYREALLRFNLFLIFVLDILPELPLVVVLPDVVRDGIEASLRKNGAHGNREEESGASLENGVVENRHGALILEGSSK
eukprot:TRINITY_DN201_c0_g1_i4.p1 TRINITY_DN201_c0_g1~~TRINITY_DN201_c0_g1_i4.p1  ORF type:complete len:110 (+),score=5.13 TRINITY_DN201_c0_g1_i4:108-437(+)